MSQQDSSSNDSTQLAKLKANEIHAYFEKIASPYDFFNHFFSLGIDYYWRHFLLQKVQDAKPLNVLDLATGSGDVALGLQSKNIQTVGADFCYPMLAQAQKKKCHHLLLADAHQLPFKENCFDCITVAFGFRNFTRKPQALREMLRVLRPNGQAFILEFSQPNKWIRPLYFFYLSRIMPGITSLLYREKSAYEHLSNSVQAFPEAQNLQQQIEKSGFSRVIYHRLTLGTVALHIASKN
ncbi:MAG: ubiquinone/menaquinone biosynthesis methyltransferase [Verrucomicrobiota bacterium]